jgi:Fur family peroxide stress response transcriptional regulator
MNRIRDVLKGLGVRVTPQRVAVYQVLATLRGHLSVDQVYEAVREKVPAISLATVYAVIQMFMDKGLIKPLNIDCERQFFDMRMDSHPHFFCQRCRRIFDLDIDLCPVLEGRMVGGHKITAFEGYFYGVCRDCRKREGG